MNLLWDCPKLHCKKARHGEDDQIAAVMSIKFCLLSCSVVPEDNKVPIKQKLFPIIPGQTFLPDIKYIVCWPKPAWLTHQQLLELNSNNICWNKFISLVSYKAYFWTFLPAFCGLKTLWPDVSWKEVGKNKIHYRHNFFPFWCFFFHFGWLILFLLLKKSMWKCGLCFFFLVDFFSVTVVI